jgi:predicted nucleic acid-binding protein
VIVLDTNVLSEALKPAPADTAMEWLAAQAPSDVYTTTVTQAELLYGIEALRHGKRQTILREAVERILAEEFSGRILPFDEASARYFATIMASRVAIGRPISQFDAMIAAIARSHGATLATRNVGDFGNCGITVINPWMD